MCETTQVNFRISDVYIPEPAQILMQLHGNDLLQGRIVDVSTSVGEENAYAIVEVEGLSQPLVVPVRHTRWTSSE
jgi:hypothetical protein